jgi:hypothetical protein
MDLWTSFHSHIKLQLISWNPDISMYQWFSVCSRIVADGAFPIQQMLLLSLINVQSAALQFKFSLVYLSYTI